VSDLNVPDTQEPDTNDDRIPPSRTGYPGSMVDATRLKTARWVEYRYGTLVTRLRTARVGRLELDHPAMRVPA
jgi:hypothetical protein